MILFAFCLQDALSQPPSIGDTPPELLISEWVQGPDELVLNWEDFKGQVVIVEFWATWCAPCLPAKKHLQEVAENFDEDELVIIAISNEESQTVENYIDRYDFDRIWFALDEENKTIDNYKPQVIPHSVIVGPDGKIAAVTYSNEVTEEAIIDLIAGKEIDLPVKEYFESPSEEITEYLEQRNRMALFKIELIQTLAPWARLIPYSEESPFYQRRFKTEGVFVQTLASEVFDVHPGFIVTEEGVTEERFDVDIIIPYPDENELKNRLHAVVEETLDLQIGIEKRDMDVRVLKPIDTDKPGISPSTADTTQYSMRGPLMEAVNQPIKVLTDYMSNFFEEPVIDGTGLTGTYDFSMEWNMADHGTFYDEVNRLGFELVRDNREIEVVVIKRNSN